MASSKKGAKSKFITEDINELMNATQFMKESPINRKNLKRSKVDNTIEEDDISNTVQLSGKKKKIEANIEAGRQSRQKIIEVMDQQLTARSQSNDTLLKCLSELTTQLEADHSVMKENEQKLEQLTGALIKCIQQATTAHKQKLKALKEIHDTFKKQCDNMQAEQKAETDQLANELEEDIKKLQQKLVLETKRSGWEAMRRVEGLLTKGAMKPDDRPLWFDVYRAFPPYTEPKFAKPKPEIKPIRPILYKEDAIRAKFHSNGHGFAAVNLLNQTTDTQIKRLVQQYKKLESEGIPESEIIEKSAAMIASERHTEASKINVKDPESATAQILSEADLKNIFKE